MSPLESPTPPPLPHRRGRNASLATIRKGHQPVLQDKAGNYFKFRTGQIRRQLGFGHSAAERLARRLRRNADYASRREYKRARAQS